MPNTTQLNALTLSIALSTATAHANEPKIEEVIVLSPLARTAQQTAAHVSYLAGNALRNEQRGSLGATLQNQPGVSFASFGPGVGQPTIRGQGGARVLSLQDGTASGDLSSISPDHANTLEPLLAERIEVLRGPATLLYGSGAIGGVINVIDNRIPSHLPERSKAEVEIRHDSASDQDASVFKADTSLGQTAWHADGFYRDHNDVEVPGWAVRNPAPDTTDGHGHIPNSGGRAHGGSAGGSWVGEQGFVGFAASRMESAYGVPSDEESVRIDMQQTRYSMKGEYETANPWLAHNRFFLSHNDYTHTEFEDGVTGTVFDNDTHEFRLENSHSIAENWEGSLGLQLSDRKLVVSGEEAVLPNANINSSGVFLTESYTWNRWVYELGIRLEQQRIDATQEPLLNRDAHSGSASVLWNFSNDDTTYLTMAHAERALAIEELYSCGVHHATESYEVGLFRNADCSVSGVEAEEEMSRNFELGYRRHTGSITGEINAYVNYIDNFAYARNTGETDLDSGLPIHQYTLDQARFYGAEARATLPMASTPQGDWSISPFADVVRATLDDGSAVPRIPPRRIGATLAYQFQAWAADLRLTHASAQRRAGNNEESTDGYNDLTLHLSYTLPMGDGQHCELFLRGSNLTNEEIRNAASYLRDLAPEPGRSFESGVRLSF